MTCENGCVCHECGEPMFLDEGDVSHHGTPEDIDYDADEDHTPFCDET